MSKSSISNGAGEALQYDPALLLPGFEDEADMERMDRRIVRALVSAGHHDQAHDLQRAMKRGETPPPWSFAGHRNFRRWFTDQAVGNAYLAEVENNQLGLIASIIPAGFVAPVGGLCTIAPRDIVKAIWNGLDRPDFRGLRVIGGSDISFNERAGANQDPGYYQVHAGLAFLGHPTDIKSRNRLREALKAGFKLEATSAIPVQVKELRDPVVQLSYLMKRLFVRRVSIIDSRGRHNTLSRPLKLAQEAEIAAWLSSASQTDRLILKGFHRYGNRLVPTPSRRSSKDGK